MTYEDHIAAVAHALAEEHDAEIAANQATRLYREAENRRGEAEQALRLFNRERISEHMSAGVA